ncbi:MAG: MucR family transcriptional regulator [Hyphomicrobiaceae bacterium]|nr:MucR family transcriptional regulator [Hyphomicrobiaceae bacterium]
MDTADVSARIVTGYVTNNTLDVKELPILISSVYSALLLAHVKVTSSEFDELIPAVSKDQSVFPDYIICLEDGKEFKSLKRHLKTKYKMSPEEYRKKWKLAPDYPMVAPNYAKERSQLAKKMGLGTRREV